MAIEEPHPGKRKEVEKDVEKKPSLSIEEYNVTARYVLSYFGILNSCATRIARQLTSERLNLQYYLWEQQTGYQISPQISLKKENMMIADLGTGTG